MLYLARRCLTRRGRRKLGLSILTALSRLVPPTAIFKVTGVLPFRECSRSHLSATTYTPDQTSPTVEHHEPGSIYPHTTWTVFPVQVDDKSELIFLPKGLSSSSGHVFDQKGYLVARAAHKKRYAPELGWVPPRWRPFPEIAYFPATVASITASTQWNYYHWLFDVLPRLAMVQELWAQHDYLYLQHSRRFQKESLSLVGIDESAILNCDQCPLIRAHTLLVPCHQSTGRNKYPTWVRDKLRDWFLPKADSHGPRRRLYLGRSKEHGRRISNEDEIFSYLATLDFEYLLPERLSFLEQVRAFRDADFVVAAHGAGLANIVFCDPGVGLIELFPRETKYTYYKISQLLNLNYFYVRTPGPPNRIMSRSDYYIPLEDLKQTLKLADIPSCPTSVLSD